MFDFSIFGNWRVPGRVGWSAAVLACLFSFLSTKLAAQPANDNFDAAIELVGSSGTISGTLVDATSETGETRYHGVGEHSVWYEWTAPNSGQVTFDLGRSSADAVVAAYTGASVDSVMSVSRVGPTAIEVSSCVQFFASGGVTYQIAVSGATSISGPDEFVLNWSMGSDPAASGSPFAGQFRFSLANYRATEVELNVAPLPPPAPILLRSARGAVITVNRIGGAAGRALVDYRTMDEFGSDAAATVIVSLTNVIDSMMGSFTNEGNIAIYYTNVYAISSRAYLTNIVLTNIVADTNLCGTDPSCMLSTNVILNCMPDSFPGIACPSQDYFPANGTLFFDEFETSKRFVVLVLTDSAATGTKQVKLELFNPRLADEETNNPTGLLPPTRDCAGSIANLNILDVIPGSGGGTNFSIERVSYAVNEGTNSISLDIIHPSGTGGNVDVTVVGSEDELRYVPSSGSDYATDITRTYDDPLYTDGTTTNITAQDFVAFTTNVTFAPNEFRRTITIQILDDNEVEFNEDIFVYLEDVNGQPPIGANGSAWVTILDNDQPAGALDRLWNPDNVSATTPRFNLTPGANNIVRALAVQADQRTIIGGDFTAYNATPRNRMARINPDGSLDSSFNPGTGADGFVNSVAVYRNTGPDNNGKAVVGGGFTSINNIQRNGVARLNVNGSLDTTFDPGTGANGTVYSVAIQNDGKVIVAGDFTEFNNVARPGVARLNADGSLDSTFDPGAGADGVVWSVAVRDGNQSIFVPRAAEGTEFEDVNEIEVGATQGTITVDYDFLNIVDTIRVYYESNRIFDLTTNGVGQLMIPFGPGNSTKVTIILNEGIGEPGTLWRYTANIAVPAVARNIFIGGEFLNFDGEFRGGVARLEDDGSLDMSFNPGAGADGPVYVVAAQADGRLLMGGAFSSVNFNPRHRLARLNFDGTVDDSYNRGGGPNDSVYAIALQPDGKALVGGVFTSFNHTRRLGVTRLFLNGTVDTSFLDTAYNAFAGLINTFHFQPANYVNAIGLQTNGGVMIGGSFTNVGGNFALNAVDDGVPWVQDFIWPFGGVLNGVTGWHRAEKHPRYNVARLIGGYTPGPGNVEFVSDQNTTDENAGSLSAALRRIDGRLGTAGAVAGTTNNLAIGGSDFESSFSSIFWPEDFFLDEPISVGDVTESFFSVSITNDTEIEGDELFGLGLALPFGSINLGGEIIPLGTALGRSAATVTIADNDFNHGVLAFSSPTFFTNENSGVARITVVRTNGSSGLITVRYSTANGTAIAGQDYTLTQGTLTFGSGVTSQFLDVPIFNDNLREDDETFFIVLTNATGGATLPGGLPTSTNAIVVTIIDNDLLSGKANFAFDVFAENEGGGVAQVMLTRLGGSVGELRVSAAATPDTATAGTDFTAVTNTIVWVHGDVAPKTFPVPLLDDLTVEGDETINLSLFNPSPPGATGSVNVATLTITEDDFFGALSFSQPFYDTDERGSNAVITVVRTGGSGGTVSVEYVVESGTATNAATPSDFIASTGTLTFAPGVVATNFQITILDDGLQDGERTVALRLTNSIDAVLGAVPDATLRIIDDESIGEPAGALDTTFNAGAGANETVNALALQPDGKILAAGAFNTMNRVFRSRVARLEASGALDGLFNAGEGPNRAVRAMVLQPDDRILIAGLFEQVHGTNRNHIARLLPDGSVDVFFNPGAGADNPVFALGLLSDGGVVLGGAFAAVNGVSRPGIAVLNTDGSLRATFDPGEGVNGTVFAIAVQTDGKILIGGEFDSVGGVARENVARLHADGSLDLAFDPGIGPDGIVNTIAIQADGRILIGGTFTQVAGQPRGRLARLEANGDLDADFQASGEGADASVLAIALQFDGKIVVVGEFTRFNDVSRSRITRLHPDGGTDSTINFGQGANDAIHTVSIQPDRKIVIGGRFTLFDGQPRSRIARLHGGSIAGSGAFQFSTPFYDAHETNATAIITVQRRGGTAGSVTVDYSSMAGTAAPDSDYTDVSGMLVFGEGETIMTFTVPVVNDNIGELDEDVILSLSNPTGGAVLGDIPTALLTIISDDANIGFSSALYTVNENVAGGDLVVTVLRTGATNSEAQVNFATTNNGSAGAGADYVAASGVLVFAPGQTTRTFSVPIIDDSLIEPTETFGLLLSNVVGSVALGQAAATASILDNDFDAGALTFSATAYSVAEGAGNIVITILRTNGSTGVITVSYATVGDTATPGLDFAPVNGILTFLEGQILQTISIAITNDSVVEGDEDFIVSLSNPTGGTVISGLSDVVVTIQDDEFGPGSLDLTFDPGLGANGLVRAVAVQPSGKVLIGGAFTEFDGLARKFVARLEQDGSLDLGFDPVEGPDAFVAAVAPGVGDKAVLGGSFDMLGAIGFNRIAQLNDDGTPDSKFNRAVGLNASVFALGVQTNGRILVGGAFSLPSRGISRLHANGSVDASFAVGSGANGAVHTAIEAPGGNIVLAGAFTSVSGEPRSRVARLTSAGALDTSFGTGAIAEGTAFSVAAQPDGKLVVVGDFRVTGSSNRTRIARLNVDGSLDATFDVGLGADATVYAAGLQSSGKIIIAGDFTSVDGVSRNRYARLNTDGSLDAIFDPGRGANNTIFSLVVLPDDNVIIAGDFTSITGVPRQGVARLRAADPAPLALGGFAQGGGQFAITVPTQAGKTYVLEASRNLITWTSIATNTAMGGTWMFTDANMATTEARFFRVVEQ